MLRVSRGGLQEINLWSTSRISFTIRQIHYIKAKRNSPIGLEVVRAARYMPNAAGLGCREVQVTSAVDAGPPMAPGGRPSGPGGAERPLERRLSRFNGP